MFTETLAVALGAVCLEALFGYPNWLYRVIGHPVTWLGALLAALDRRLNLPQRATAWRRLAGAAAVVLLLLVGVGGALLIETILRHVLPHLAALFVLALLASSLLAQRSLATHVAAVARPLAAGDLGAARHAVGHIVGRDTAELDEAGVARAAIESLAENFSDGIVAPLLFLAAFGLPGGVFYKAVNTADSMIGHRTPRHAAFGFTAAKVDDVVNFLPARFAALLIVVAAVFVRGANPSDAWRIVRRDARGHASPNAGWPEAAMAGAIGVRLGGARRYQGRLVEDHPINASGASASAAAIERALRVYGVACGLEAAVLALLVALTVRG